MPLSPYALATLAELKEYLGGQGTGQSTRLENALNTSSAVIENYLGRQIVSRGALEEYHTFRALRSELLLLDWPVLSVTDVWEDETRAYATALTVDADYIVSKPSGSLLRIGGANAGEEAWATGFRAVKVAYTAGYVVANVPWDIRDAALWVAAHLFSEAERKSWDVSSKTDGLGTVTRFTLSRLPGYMKDQLVAHRRVHGAGRTGERDS